MIDYPKDFQMNTTDLFRSALVETEEKLKVFPNFQLLISIRNQLIYLIRLMDGTETDRTVLSTIIIGLYAVREFEESDPTYASLLQKCQYEVEVLRTGVRRRGS